jgi:hypothetical protein
MPILGSSAGAAKGAPGAPTIGTATVTNSTTVSLTFTAPSFSKLPITSYTVTSSPSIALSTSGTSSPLTVTGSFVASTNYTFTISAVNPNGTSAESSASNSVKPNLAVFYYTSSTTFTPSSYPFNYTAYVVGGGGGVSGSTSASASQVETRGMPGGGGSGFFTTETGTINSGSATVTIGTVGNNGANGGATAGAGGAGGTSTFFNTNSSGGNGSNSPNSANQVMSNGGNGGSGGGAGGGVRIHNVNGAIVNFRGGGNGGSAGGTGSNNSGNMTAGNNGTGSGNTSSPSGGPGGGSTSNADVAVGTFTAYNGITVAGSSYGSGRGNGSYASNPFNGVVTSGNAGYVLVVES